MVRKINREHVPFPMPDRPHALSQEWRNLIFMHWEVEPSNLEPYIPENLELDLFEGKAYVGTIPFQMKNEDQDFFLPAWNIDISLNSISALTLRKTAYRVYYFSH